MTEECRRYLEDPETHASHLAACADCNALFGRLDLPSARGVEIDALPLAPWEGASYRSWPLVAGVTLLLMALAFALAQWAGISPLAGIEAAVASVQSARGLVASLGDRLRDAGAVWQACFAIAIIVVNVVLVRLLRRPPRGVDA